MSDSSLGGQLLNIKYSEITQTLHHRGMGDWGGVAFSLGVCTLLVSAVCNGMGVGVCVCDVFV